MRFDPKPEYLSKVKFPPILERRRYNHQNGSESKTPDNSISDPVIISEPNKILDPVKINDQEIISDSGKVFNSEKISDLRIESFNSPVRKNGTENPDGETLSVSLFSFAE